MAFRSLAGVGHPIAFLIFDELLAVVPRATRVGHEDGQEHTGDDDAGLEAAQRLNLQQQADDDGRNHGQHGQIDQVALGGDGRDGDGARVVRLPCAFQDAGDAELAADFIHHLPRSTADGANCQRGEHPRQRPAQQHTDEDERRRHADAIGQRLRVNQRHVGDERTEERHGGDDRRADGDPLGDGLGRVAHRVQVGHDFAGFWLQSGHFADAVGVVRDRPERVHGHVVARQRQHADAGHGDAVEDEGELDELGREASGDKLLGRDAVKDEDNGHDGGGDDEDRPDGRLIARRQTGEDGSGRAAGRGVADFLDRTEMGAGKVVGQAVDNDGQTNARGCREERPPPSTGNLIHVDEGDRGKRHHGDGRRRQEAAKDGLHGVAAVVGLALHQVGADDGGQHADAAYQ